MNTLLQHWLSLYRGSPPIIQPSMRLICKRGASEIRSSISLDILEASRNTASLVVGNKIDVFHPLVVLWDSLTRHSLATGYECYGSDVDRVDWSGPSRLQSHGPPVTRVVGLRQANQCCHRRARLASDTGGCNAVDGVRLRDHDPSVKMEQLLHDPAIGMWAFLVGDLG